MFDVQMFLFVLHVCGEVKVKVILLSTSNVLIYVTEVPKKCF